MKYLIRIDDACPTMDVVKWDRIGKLLDKYGIRPMVGIIPANADSKQKFEQEDPNFWKKVNKWKQKGWVIALHGYDHCYISKERGINPLWPRSEFAGVPLDKQKEKIRKGIEILASHDIHPKYFFAPSHTFDENTLIALKECSDIRIISDTIALRPYRSGDFVFIPQLGGSCREMPLSGIWTFCLHPSVMTDEAFEHTEAFLKKNADKFISFNDIDTSKVAPKSLKDRIISSIYFCYRRLKKL